MVTGYNLNDRMRSEELHGIANIPAINVRMHERAEEVYGKVIEMIDGVTQRKMSRGGLGEHRDFPSLKAALDEGPPIPRYT